jgi:hypothetical protein
MSAPPRKRLFPNPFYVLLLACSTLFVLTTLGYLVAPLLADLGHAPDKPGQAGWFDRNAPTALGVEFVVMLAAGLLAMATDRWFPERVGPGGPKS